MNVSSRELGNIFILTAGLILHACEYIGTSDRMKYLDLIFHENFKYFPHIDDVTGWIKAIYDLSEYTT